MLLISSIVLHGFIYAIILIAYLFFVMVKFNPRIWGFSDYPKVITDRVPPQTKSEKRMGSILGIPFFLFGLGFPIISTLILRDQSGGEINFFSAFFNIFGILMFGNAADLLILDWIIVGTITPKFVIIPGTEDMKDTGYKDFRIDHAKGHIWGTLFIAASSLLLALIIILL